MLRLIRYSLLRGRRLRRGTEGMAAVEFALLATVLLLIVTGILDFGHAMYVQQVITSASRAGARYGVAFTDVDTSGPTAVRRAPNALSPTIQNYVLNNCLAGTGITATVTPGGAGYTTGAKGQPVQVTVTATKRWFLLNRFVSGLPTSLTATTVMPCE